ncbi:MAG: hypothetical protein QG606_140, partial [Patescibacteria group bacterium]|nr:hypothetical protein [Patescibacteria group bacterium]
MYYFHPNTLFSIWQDQGYANHSWSPVGFTRSCYGLIRIQNNQILSHFDCLQNLRPSIVYNIFSQFRQPCEFYEVRNQKKQTPCLLFLIRVNCLLLYSHAILWATCTGEWDRTNKNTRVRDIDSTTSSSCRCECFDVRDWYCEYSCAGCSATLCNTSNRSIIDIGC